MDPFSQGFLGSWAALKVVKKKTQYAQAAFCGFISGLLPDADIFIKSNEDSLLAIQYHRHFTHSLAFIPIGALLASIFCYYIFRKKLPFKQTFLFCLLGYATHGFLDAMTSYGTHLYLPFSYERVSWSIISVVDPLFTLPLIIMVVLAIWKKSKKPIYWITSYMILYLSIGVIQHGRVEDKILNMAIERGHQVENYVVKPTIGNNILWRTIYKSGDRLYVDLIRSNWIGDMKHYQAGELKARSFPKDFKLIDKDSDLYFDLQRFFHFSNNMVGYEDNAG